MVRATLALLAALLLAPAAQGGGPRMALGVAEDNVKSTDRVQVQARLSVLRLAGFDALRVTSIWAPGQTAPSPQELASIRNVAVASRLAGIRLYVSLYHAGSRTTPLTPEARAAFVAYAAALVAAVPELPDLIVGNEPNLNRFWLPQFNPDGTNAAAPAYLALLAATYDAVKAVRPTLRVWGGALAARGNDRPGTARDTHSPTKFLRDLGAALRASGRTLPIMDGFAHHPYPGDSSRPPGEVHANSTTIGLGDYPRLVRVLGEAFGGTAQPGATLPILYDEFGIESQVPAWKAGAYTGTEPATTKPIPETAQAASYAQAIALAFCQPTVTGLLLFHSHDEPQLAAWQSGVFYADGAPKTSLVGVRDALARARGGSIARCPGLALTVSVASVRFPAAAELRRGRALLRFRCLLDCAYTVRLHRGAAVVGTLRSYARAGLSVETPVAERGVRPGSYRISLTVSHPLNPGAETVRQSAPVSVG